MFARRTIVQTFAARAAVACACAAALGAAAQQPLAMPDGTPAAARAWTAASAPAAAQPAIQPAAIAVSPVSAATAAEIQKINEQITLLQARLNELDVRAKIAAKQREINPNTREGAVQSSFDPKSGVPSVVSVAGLKGNLEALLVFPGGATQRVKAGDVIDDRRVAKVAINEVVLTDLKGRNAQRLGFGTSPLIHENTSQPPSGPSSPMPLPMGAPTPPGPRPAWN